MGGDEIVLRLSKRELQVFALWADAHRDDAVTEGLLGDPRGIEAYRRAFAKLDEAAWGDEADAPSAEAESSGVLGNPVEYRVRRIEGEGVEGAERVCNDLARDGWRLVTASTAADGGAGRCLYLFFSREVADEAIALAATKFSVMAAH